MESPKPVAGKKRPTLRMLVVGRDPSALGSLWSIGQAQGWHLEVADSGWDALERLQSGSNPDLLMLNLPPSDGHSLHALRLFKRIRPDLPIIVLSYPQEAIHRAEVLRLGARECLLRPLEQKHLENAMRRCVSSRAHYLEPVFAGEEVEPMGKGSPFVARSLAMRELCTQIELLAQVNVPVLIVGECSSGQEAAARLIHDLSNRSGFEFLTLNCAALSRHLLESELFGYERGAFAGVLHDKAGKFELAQNGTIFLDEIAEMPTSLQAKLLQVLQDKECFRLGGDTSIKVDVRILAATNINIEHALKEKKIREDLYYRLSAFTLQVPPLRQRREEIPALIFNFMGQMASHYGLPARSVSPVLLEACQAYSWPGNLRELEHFVKRYLVIGDEKLALRELERNQGRSDDHPRLDPNLGSGVEGQQDEPGLKSLLQAVKGEAEKNAIAAALDQTRWNRKAAARLLKVSYRALLYKIEQHQMSPPAYAAQASATGGLRRRVALVGPNSPQANPR